MNGMNSLKKSAMRQKGRKVWMSALPSGVVTSYARVRYCKPVRSIAISTSWAAVLARFGAGRQATTVKSASGF